MPADTTSWAPTITPQQSRYWLARRTKPIGEHDRSSEGSGRTALVTGASSGIGLAWCELLAAKGFDIVPVARRLDRLNALKQRLEADWAVSVSPMTADLSRPGAPAEIYTELARRNTTVDVLVNNAGYSIAGRFIDNSWSDQEAFLRVIGLSGIELTHLLLPSMIERRWGRIVFVASIAAVMSGLPGQVLYSAGKSLVHKFSEGLAEEVERLGVHSTVSLPGTTDTDIFDNSNVTEFTEGLAMQMTMMSPIAVARQGFEASKRGDRMIVHGKHHQIGTFVMAHAPRPLRYLISGRLALKAMPELHNAAPQRC